MVSKNNKSDSLTTVSISRENLSTLMLCAFRYALGRKTYMPSLVSDIIKSNITSLTEADKQIIVKEISEEDKRYGLGDSCDVDTWLNLQNTILASVKKEGVIVCKTCHDTHRMVLNDKVVMCTHCPIPCQDCRSDGYGAFCSKTPCLCNCHK